MIPAGHGHWVGCVAMVAVQGTAWANDVSPCRVHAEASEHSSEPSALLAGHAHHHGSAVVASLALVAADYDAPCSEVTIGARFKPISKKAEP